MPLSVVTVQEKFYKRSIHLGIFCIYGVFGLNGVRKNGVFKLNGVQYERH